VIGHAVQLRDLPGGLYGAFRVHDGVKGDEALVLAHEGVLTGVSLRATPLRSREVDGVTQRLRAHLTDVSLCVASLSTRTLESSVSARHGGPISRLRSRRLKRFSGNSSGKIESCARWPSVTSTSSATRSS